MRKKVAPHDRTQTCRNAARYLRKHGCAPVKIKNPKNYLSGHQKKLTRTFDHQTTRTG